MENKRAEPTKKYKYASENNNTYKLSDAKKKHNKRKMNNRITAFCVTFVVIIIAGWLLFDKLFIIRRYEIRGSAEYTSEQAMTAAKSIGILPGEHIFGFDKKNAVMESKYHLPQFDSVEISFEMPDTVILNVKEAIPCMYTVFGNSGYILSEGLRVISAHTDASEYESSGLIRVDFGTVTKCVAGEFIETSGNSAETVKKLYSVLKEEGVAVDVTAVDVSDKFDISFEYKKQFDVKLGDDEGLTVKIRYMKAIVNELGESDSGVIDVSDEKHRDATFKPYSKM